ncbi:103aa long hypothetical protein [Pyrococcus horikoshii OT3]|uniref:Uncharacterized protein n=1 Tax=Pyrococcus horikoshii (strain ATCC 700860 / DSM 12428 / JCM 9974 / NBRC 100139 / OT-3) TaxID=70601 RepID=O59400_PYRHO|nr:103aa long hypothetical protein [Pyrococcus horikoshii OT3]
MIKHWTCNDELVQLLPNSFYPLRMIMSKYCDSYSSNKIDVPSPLIIPYVYPFSLYDLKSLPIEAHLPQDITVLPFNPSMITLSTPLSIAFFAMSNFFLIPPLE